MKKKFDFSAEIESAESRTNQEYRERYEQENKVLKVNAEELMKLNDNIHEMRTVLEQLTNAVQHYEYKIASTTLKQTENLGNGLISKLCNELDVQYSKFEARMKEHKDEDRIRVPTRVFYISVICLITLFCFFHLHHSSQYSFTKLRFALEDYRVEHRDGYYRYWHGDSCSEIVGTIKVDT